MTDPHNGDGTERATTTRSSPVTGVPPSSLADRIELYLDDTPHGGGHSDAAGANCWELLEEAMNDLRAPAQAAPSDAVREALELARKRIEYFGEITTQRHQEANEQYFLPPIDNALAALTLVSSTDRAPIGGSESCTCHFFGAGTHHVPGCPYYSVVTSTDRGAVPFDTVTKCRSRNNRCRTEAACNSAGRCYYAPPSTQQGGK